MRRYLLGQMSEAEEARLERAYLGSDEALEELRAHEDELIEDYLANGLDPAEKDRFERRFLASPGRLERLLFLRALADRAGGAKAGPPARAARSWVPAAAGFAAVAVAGLLAARALGPRAPSAEAPAPSAAPASVAPPAGGPTPAAPAAAVSATVSLRVPAVRADADVPVVDPGGAAQVVLELPLDPRDPFSAHRGRVAAPDGSDAFVSPWQPNRGEATLRVVVPSSALRAGRHVVVVEGAGPDGEEPVESYAFRVRRREP